ncbi:MAG TPA: hypothetical protein VGP63_17510 [Planctomycetaceae bacterium]|jgi:hypothetical protein|nr:hypothetical protein [Planctomycetaceae bacterium]
MKSRGLLSSAVVGSLALGLLAGCMDSLAKQVKKDPNSIIGKKTDDIKEFDPKAKQVVSDSKVHITDPILGPLEAYGPIMETIHVNYVKHAIDLFHAEEDRYPKDHEEFMRRIIKANQIKLPVLPGGAKYAYDVENHVLRVVKADAPANGGAAPAK